MHHASDECEADEDEGPIEIDADALLGALDEIESRLGPDDEDPREP